MRPCVWWQTSIAGGPTKGDEMHWCKAGVTAPNGDKTTYGQLGEVMGPGDSSNMTVGDGWSCDVQGQGCLKPQGSDAKKSLIRWKSTKDNNWDVCAVCKETPHGHPLKRDDAIAMKFPGNKGNVNCYLTQLSLDPPVRVGWVVWWVKSGVEGGV